MSPQEQPVSRLRQRLLEDLQLRQLKPKTIAAYIRHIKQLADFLGHSPHTATEEELRQFHLSLVKKDTSRITYNTTLSSIRFLFKVTLNQPDKVRHLTPVPVPRKLPRVLSREEVTRLLEGVQHPKYKAALSVAYGAGLRCSEIASLKISDIDSERMTLHIEQGKGRKDRYAMLSPALLQTLREWWCYGNEHKMLLKSGWLFPGINPVVHISNKMLSYACKKAAVSAGLGKDFHLHLLRHAFATHLLEQGVDIRVIQVLLGHAKLESTALYTQVATKMLKEVTSPLDLLPDVN